MHHLTIVGSSAIWLAGINRGGHRDDEQGLRPRAAGGLGGDEPQPVVFGEVLEILRVEGG
jgi:hypothetical protein